MPTIDNAAVEAEARALLRERIERSPWYPDLSDQERRERIEDDVERYWAMVARTRCRTCSTACEASRLAWEAEIAIQVGGFYSTSAQLRHRPHPCRELVAHLDGLAGETVDELRTVLQEMKPGNAGGLHYDSYSTSFLLVSRTWSARERAYKLAMRPRRRDRRSGASRFGWSRGGFAGQKSDAIVEGRSDEPPHGLDAGEYSTTGREARLYGVVPLTSRKGLDGDGTVRRDPTA